MTRARSFEDLDAAKVEAARIAGEWLRDNADEFAQDGALLIEVLDERRAVLATIAVEADTPTGTMHWLSPPSRRCPSAPDEEGPLLRDAVPHFCTAASRRPPLCCGSR